MLDFITTSDHRLMRMVQQWSAPYWVRRWMIWATRVGNGWLWYAMGFALLLFGGANRFAAIGSAALSVGLGIVCFLGLKRITGRRRPCDFERHCWANLLPPDQFSFPSGHTITAFAFAVPVHLFYPSLMIGLLFCALSIALSRILLGMHFLSDVVAGAFIGSMLGYASYAVFL